MRYLIVLIGVLGLFAIVSPAAKACTCGGAGKPCESYGEASAVFVGTAISFRDAERRKGGDREEFDWAPRTFKFSVEQPYLGVTGTEIEVATGFGGGDCGYQFKIGQRYLVYAYGEKKLTTSICTRTKSFASANEDLAFLGNLSSAPPGATIYGQVVHDKKGDSSSLGPDVVVTIEGDNVRREIRPDAQGRYRVSGLPPGKFKVTLQLPDTLTTYQPQREISVADRGCAAVGYHLTDNGKVSGRVFDPEGRPVARILVSLVEPDSDPKTKYVKLERTDEEGNYSFSAVPAGRYIIAVNFNRYPDPNDPTNAYPGSFYPGVTDQPNAEVITLAVGEKLTGLNIRVPPRKPLSVVTGQVVWADGSPVVKASLTVTDVTNYESSVGHGIQADEQGKFVINGYIGQKLIIEARSNRPYVPTGARFDPMERSEKVRITLERPAETLKFVITKLR